MYICTCLHAVQIYKTKDICDFSTALWQSLPFSSKGEESFLVETFLDLQLGRCDARKQSIHLSPLHFAKCSPDAIYHHMQGEVCDGKPLPCINGLLSPLDRRRSLTKHEGIPIGGGGGGVAAVKWEKKKKSWLIKNVTADQENILEWDRFALAHTFSRFAARDMLLQRFHYSSTSQPN